MLEIGQYLATAGVGIQYSPSIFVLHVLIDCLDADVYGLCLRTSLLLQFMEYLERHLYNAIEGCAVTMTPLPKVLLFRYVILTYCDC